ncbi:MAG: hypothetical protein R3D44_17110 [Hyphomicrobiaceae bacterium]
MAEQQVKLEITPRVVDLGDRVIQLQHVVSAGRHTIYPLRPIGAVAMLAGIGLIANEVVARGPDAFKLQAGGSLALWIGFLVLGIGLFLLLFVRRILSIQTSDGRRIELSAESEEAATALILRIRHAMEAAGGPYASPAMQSTAEPGTLPPWTGAPAGLPHHQMSHPHHAAEAKGVRTVPAGRQGAGYTNGHAGGAALGSAGGIGADSASITEQAVQAYRRAGSGGGQHERASAAAERRLGGPDPGQGAARDQLALPATLPAGFARDDGVPDLIALMEHVRRSDVQHKEALLDLLRVVEDHYRGRATREDALAHWRSFADYVVQYLGDVDGLIAHTERFGRHMLPR